jgi:hypothetical protein
VSAVPVEGEAAATVEMQGAPHADRRQKLRVVTHDDQAAGPRTQPCGEGAGAEPRISLRPAGDEIFPAPAVCERSIFVFRDRNGKMKKLIIGVLRERRGDTSS